MARRFPARSHTLWHLLLLTILVVAVLGFYLQRELRLTEGVLGVPLDDAFIHFQFARNLSSGQGFSFNAGEPTAGSTAPFWTLILAGMALVTDDLLLPAVLLSAVMLLATVWLTYGLTRELTDSALAGLLAAVGVALTGRFLWAGLAGMETTAFAACSVAAVWLYHRRGLDGWSGLFFGLSSQLRPEGHALFAIIALDLFLRWRTGKFQRQGRQSLWGLIVYLLISLPYPLFSLSTTGRPLPNTFYAKANTQIAYSWRTLRETLALHWQDNPVAFLLLPIGLIPTWRKERVVVWWLLGLLLLTPLIVGQVWHHGRYTIPLAPFQMVVAAVGFDWLMRQLRTRAPSAARVAGAVVVTLLLIAGVWRLGHWANMLATNSREIQEIDQALGRWLADNSPPDALIAVDDIGAIGYLSGRRILDLQGLVSPELWPLLAEPDGLARNQAMTRELSARQPDYLAIFPNWHFELAAEPRIMEPVQRFWVDTHTIIFDQEAMVYRPHWPYVEEARPEFPTAEALGDQVTLLGYDLEPNSDGLALQLYWQSEEALDEAYDVFVHLIDEAGGIVAQVDEQPLGGLAPTDRWQPGDILRDPHWITLPEELMPARYALQVGMFRRSDGVRLGADRKGGQDVIILQELWLPSGSEG